MNENNNQIASLFERMGGLTGVKNLADEFYNVMESDKRAKALRQVHPEKLINTRIKLYRFLSEWLGGPKLFGAQHVTVKWLELRHRHFNLTQEHEDQWLYCMNMAMTNLVFDAGIKDDLNTRFSAMVKSMRAQREKISSGMSS